MRIPTFSINPSIYKQIDKITDIVGRLETEGNIQEETKEWLGEAFIRVMEGKVEGAVNLKAFSKNHTHYEYLNQKHTKEVSIIDEKERAEGYIGVTELVADCVKDTIEEVVENIDMEYYINNFIKVRRQVYFQLGEDVWRLIELSKLDDKRAQKTLREIIDEYKIKELLEGVIRNPRCMDKLEVILC